jgi:hypothetical protein
VIDTNLFFLLLNGVFTITCSLVLSYYALKKRVTGSLFHYAWAAGFLLYGINIFLRAAGFLLEVAQILFFTAFIFFVIGIWYLCRAKQFLVIFSVALSFLFISGLLVFLGLVSQSFLTIISYSVLFLFVAMAIFQHRMLFGRSADRLAIGWVLLYFTNVLLTGFGWVVDAFAVTAKVIILFGVLDYDFVVIAERAREKRFPAPEAGYGVEGGLKLLMSSENSNANLREGNWLRKKASENVKEGIETIVFAFQDVVPHKELRAIKWISPEKVSVYLFSSSAQKVKAEFIVLPMGLTQIGAALSQATAQCQKSDKGCTVVFLHLSLLIQVFGAEAVYNMLLNKMGYIRENGVNLYAVFYPTMHSDPSTISLFTRLADESIKL